MTRAHSLEPPRLATWLMQQFSPLLRNTPLTGDLVEAFKQGRSSGWYWRQVLWAVLIGLLNLFRKRWGCLAYAVVCGGFISTAFVFTFLPGRSSALPAVSALYAKGYIFPWPWSMVYQMAFLAAFQAVIVASALVAYLLSFRILKPGKLLRALMVIVVVLASGDVALTVLVASPFLGAILSIIRFRFVVAWVLVSTPAIFALLLGTWQANLGDDRSRPISA